MGVIAAAAGLGAATSIASGWMNYNSSKSAARQQKHAQERQEALFGIAAGQIDTAVGEYSDFLTKLDTEFDPYDVEDAFNSLYESVIQPMERDFDENVLPGIQAAYSGGVMGQGAGLSGAAASAEATARRGLSETKAGLRADERESAILRNFSEYDRRAQMGDKIFQAETISPMMRAGQAQQVYNNTSDSIAATLASKQSLASSINSFGSLGMSAASLHQQGKMNDSLTKLLSGRIGSGTTEDQ